MLWPALLARPRSNTPAMVRETSKECRTGLCSYQTRWQSDASGTRRHHPAGRHPRPSYCQSSDLQKWPSPCRSWPPPCQQSCLRQARQSEYCEVIPPTSTDLRTCSRSSKQKSQESEIEESPRVSWRPFKPAVSVFLMLCASTINSVGCALRPSFKRATPT